MSVKQNNDTNQEISNDDSEDTGESTSSSYIQEDHLDHQQEVQLLRKACLDKTLWNTIVPLPQKQSCTDTNIARPPLPNSRNSAGAMASALLKFQKSTLLNKLFKSDCSPPA